MARIVDPEGREEEALGRITAFDGLDVLDVGCGEGRTTRFIARTALSVEAIDPDADRIATARGIDAEEGSCTIDFLVEDAVTTQRPAASFDMVVFTRSL